MGSKATMSTNAFAGFVDDDDYAQSNAASVNVSKKKKKKSKKKTSGKAKSDSSKEESLGLGNTSHDILIKKLVVAGYSKGLIESTLDSMFSNNEKYDEYDAVKARLDGTEKGSAGDAQGCRSGGPEKEPTRHEQVRKEAPASSSNDSGWSTAGASKPSERDNSSGAQAQPVDAAVSKSQKQELWDRLEAATRMKPVATVMEVLIRWCRQFPDDLGELFVCKAMNQLLVNYLTDRYAAGPGQNRKDVDLMGELLSCVFEKKVGSLVQNNLTSFTVALKDLEMENDEWRRVVKNYATFMSARLGEFMSFGDCAAAIPSDLKKLQQQLQANIVSADEFGRSSVGASDAEKTANLFRRRDFASERVLLGDMIRKNTVRLSKACGHKQTGSSKNYSGFVSSSTLGNDGVVLEILGMSKDAVAQNAKKDAEAQKVQKELDALRKEESKILTPVLAEEKKVEEQVRTLESKQAELRRALEAVEGELELAYGVRAGIVAKKAELSASMKDKVDKLDSDHKGMAGFIRRAESQRKIASDLRQFDHNLMSEARNGDEVAKRVQAALQKTLNSIGGPTATQKASTEVLRSALAYATYELPCLTLMRSRVKENKEKIASTALEITSMKTLGLMNVIVDLERKEKQLRTFIDQDEGVISVLSAKAMEVFGIVTSTGQARSENIDALTSKLLSDLKKAFVALNIGVGHDWNPPQVLEEESSSMFSSNLAASLGLAPQEQLKAVAKAPESKAKPNAPVAGPKKKAAAPVAPKKSGWGAPSPASKASAGSKKTMLQLQAEELQTRLTEENLKRLELGKSPARSPLLERLMEQLEAGGH